MAEVVSPPPRRERREKCQHWTAKRTIGHEQDDYLLCPDCWHWLQCASHYRSIGCTVRQVKWWNFRDKRIIAAKQRPREEETDG